MQFPEPTPNFLSLIASSCDICIKPWIHAAVFPRESLIEINHLDASVFEDKSAHIDLVIQIECRDKQGVRFPQNDLELEIFRSGREFSLIISRLNHDSMPILWHGNHSVWMDATSGMRCQSPKESACLESLARRLKSLLVSSDSIAT